MNKLMLTVLMCFAFVVHADTSTADSLDVWKEAEPEVQVTVVPVAEPDSYKVNAVVTDLRTGTVLSRPELRVRAGTPARVEVGTEERIKLIFNVTVDASGESATYSWELRDNDLVRASESSTLVIAQSQHAH